MIDRTAIVASDGEVPQRQIRASFDDETIVVYQAFPAEIARAAVRAGRFVPPFRRDRMTWIKPSFCWMAYRCGWASKPGQERVLAIRISRTGFEWALAHSCLSHFEPDVHGDEHGWLTSKSASPVRVQWDPERDALLEPLPYRSIQIGLSGEAAHRYVDEWTTSIQDVTDAFVEAGSLAAAGDGGSIDARRPIERPYLAPDHIASRIGQHPRAATNERP